MAVRVVRGEPLRQLLDELRVSEDGDVTIRDVRLALQRISQYLAPFGGATNGVRAIARLVGGCYAEAEVRQSLDTTEEGDLAIEHGLTRIPEAILLGVDLEGLGGQLLGSPAGNAGAAGSNASRWTNDRAFVRATRTGTYRFVIV